MRDNLKRLMRITAGYGLVQWTGPFLSFIFTPIITRILTPHDYGVADYFATVASALATIAPLAIPAAMVAIFNDDAENEKWQSTLVGSALFLIVAIALPITLLVYFFAPQFALFAFGTTEDVTLFRLVSITFFFTMIGSVLTVAAQSALRVRWGMIISLATLVSTISGNLIFIVLLRWAAIGMLMTVGVTSAINAVLAIFLMYKKIGRPSLPIAKILLQTGMTLAPVAISYWVLSVLDRFFLINYVSGDELGYYAIANRLASLVGVGLSPILSSWLPLALTIKDETQAGQQIMNMTRYIVMISLTAGLGFGLFATEILLVLTRPAYLPAAPYVGFLAYIYVFNAFASALNVGVMFNKQFREASWAIVISATFNILLNYLLIPLYGLWGATIATAVGYALWPLLLYIFLRRQMLVPYPSRQVLLVLIIQFMLLLSGLMVPAVWFPLRIAIKLLLLSILPISFIFFELITHFELQQSWLFLRHRLRLASAS